jgi:hypothetical protein
MKSAIATKALIRAEFRESSVKNDRLKETVTVSGNPAHFSTLSHWLSSAYINVATKRW